VFFSIIIKKEVCMMTSTIEESIDRAVRGSYAKGVFDFYYHVRGMQNPKNHQGLPQRGALEVPKPTDDSAH
jgi:hypothetical protein